MFWDGDQWASEPVPPRPRPAHRSHFPSSFIARAAVALLALVIVPVGAFAAATATTRNTAKETTSYSESSSRITYSGTWDYAYASGYSGGKVRFSNEENASATLRFTGVGVRWVGPLGPTRGSAKVYVDGVYIKTVSQYRSQFTARYALYSARWPSSQSHTLKIVVVGTSGHPTVAIDWLRVELAADKVTPPSAPTTAPATAPTATPTTAPATAPTATPTTAPATAPTATPTTAPTTAPTATPTTAPTTAPTATPTTAPTTAPTATGVVRTISPSTSASSFTSAASDLTVDTIRFTAGTYRGWRDAQVKINRASRPLTVRFDPGVVFDGSGNTSYASPVFSVWDTVHDPNGTLGTAPVTGVTFVGPARFQNYLMGQVGVFLLIGAGDVTFDGLTFSNIAAAGTGGQQSSHLFYISRGSHDIALLNITASHLQQSDVSGAIAGVNAIHVYTGGTGPAVRNLTVTNVSVADAGWALVLRNGTTGVTVSGLSASNSGHGVPAAFDLAGGTGTVRGSATTNTVGTPVIWGQIKDMGGNSWR